MQPYISQALVATRIADMRREAETAQLARDVRRARREARRRAGRGLAPVRLLRSAKHAGRHGGRPISAAFIGRRAQLAGPEAAYATALHGEPAAVLPGGEAGAGKPAGC